MKVFKYPSYDAYVEAQTEANRAKINRVWVDKSTVDLVAMSVRYPVQRILCHGTRNGAEQQLFKLAYPDAYVVGTEIAGTATLFPMTVQHDFHEPHEDFLGRFDIVYSNSFDHAYDPLKALRTWAGQLAPRRRLFLEMGLEPDVNESSASDPLQISDAEIRALIGHADLRLLRTYRSMGGGHHRSTLYIAETP